MSDGRVLLTTARWGGGLAGFERKQRKEARTGGNQPTGQPSPATRETLGVEETPRACGLVKLDALALGVVSAVQLVSCDGLDVCLHQLVQRCYCAAVHMYRFILPFKPKGCVLHLARRQMKI